MDYILSMSTQERTVLERLKAKIAERLPLSRLVLFGSRARGDADPDSDMDILVVLDGPVGRPAEQYVRLCAWELSFEQGIILVPITVSRILATSGVTLSPRRCPPRPGLAPWAYLNSTIGAYRIVSSRTPKRPVATWVIILSR